jgi:hypothetical protein
LINRSMSGQTAIQPPASIVAEEKSAVVFEGSAQPGASSNQLDPLSGRACTFGSIDMLA